MLRPGVWDKGRKSCFPFSPFTAASPHPGPCLQPSRRRWIPGLLGPFPWMGRLSIKERCESDLRTCCFLSVGLSPFQPPLAWQPQLTSPVVSAQPSVLFLTPLPTRPARGPCHVPSWCLACTSPSQLPVQKAFLSCGLWAPRGGRCLCGTGRVQGVANGKRRSMKEWMMNTYSHSLKEMST